jgi:hypothetical protein
VDPRASSGDDGARGVTKPVPHQEDVGHRPLKPHNGSVTSLIHPALDGAHF